MAFTNQAIRMSSTVNAIAVFAKGIGLTVAQLITLRHAHLVKTTINLSLNLLLSTKTNSLC